MFPRRESNRNLLRRSNYGDVLTIELPEFRWQSEGHDEPDKVCDKA